MLHNLAICYIVRLELLKKQLKLKPKQAINGEIKMQNFKPIIWTSESIAEISKSLVAFTSEITNPKTNATAKGKKYSFNYTDLAQILNTIRPVLAKHGLAVLQAPAYQTKEIKRENGEFYGQATVSVETRVLHQSGEFMASILESEIFALDNQSIGGAISYNRRYALVSMLGIAQEDDNGEMSAIEWENQAKAQLITRLKSITDYQELRKAYAEVMPEEFKEAIAAEIIPYGNYLKDKEEKARTKQAPKAETQKEQEQQPTEADVKF